MSPQKHFWKKACIKLIVIDGTHTKLQNFRHILLVVVTFDANNEIVLLSFAIVDVEDKNNWVWFHEHLKNDLPGFEVLMSDADKGITSEAFQLSQEEVDAVSSRCARHLAKNCKEAFSYKMNEEHKNLILSLAKSRSVDVYQERLSIISAIHREWAQWLDHHKEEIVAYTFLDKDIPRWGKVTSNAVENMNSSLLDVRELPILYMILGIVQKMQTKYLAGQKQAAKWLAEKKEVTQYAYGEVTRQLKSAVRRDVILTTHDYPFIAGKVSTSDHCQLQNYLEVKMDAGDHDHKCPCRGWLETGLLCEHALALVHHCDLSPTNLWWFSQRYHVRVYYSSYKADIPALAPAGKLEPDIFFAPPDFKCPAGRPTKKRKDRSFFNKTDRLIQCTGCGGLGHNYRTCNAPSTEFQFRNNHDKAIAWARDNTMVCVED